ncbi:MAG: DNA mismatch repair protein MutS [Acidobacteriia bacterium]|nr:DNA mismatch repair protein MutS [Terriglobia bacterium]
MPWESILSSEPRPGGAVNRVSIRDPRGNPLESRFVLPSEQYQQRLDFWRSEYASSERRFRQLGNARLITAVAAVILASLSFGTGSITAWWLIAPLVIFISLAIVHDRVDRKRAAAARAIAYFEHALARLGNQWIGKGNQGERFRDPKHVYADDLDLFGRGSLFELLSTARTGAGESTLASWLLAPGDPEEVAARQQSVAELRARVDLREELALMGEDIRAAVDAHDIAKWGKEPPVPFFAGARIAAAVLAAAAFGTFVLFLAHILPLTPFLIVILIELGFGMTVRESVARLEQSVQTPARELRLLMLLLQRLETEPFTSPCLVALKRALETEGRTASQQIQRLGRRIEQLDVARLNMFFRPIAAPLLWIPQYAMAIEKWRRTCGPHIGQWTAAIGEFEALCSLACFAYERPAAVFPELIIQADPEIEAGALSHPLIPAGVAVANDVSIGGATRLWIVSGSNMSGKSTLMRAIGLNTVLAWAGAPVTASRMRVSRLHIGASMRANDSLADNRSRFYAEISRLRDIVELVRAGHPTLFLLDELLSGTNSHDRRIGAESLVRGLVERGAIGLVTTHDLALSQIVETLAGRAINVHFEDHLEGGEIRFDYRLRPGVVTRSNALELMRAVGLEV